MDQIERQCWQRAVVFNYLDDCRMSFLQLKNLNASGYRTTAAAVEPLQIDDGGLLVFRGRVEKLDESKIDFSEPPCDPC